MFETRGYQEKAMSAIYDSLSAGEHPVCNLPTGAGKGYLIGRNCAELSGRILVATHRKELLSQNERAAKGLGVDDIGIYSAGLGRQDEDARVVLGGIQSIYTRIDKLQCHGRFDYIIVDECHLVQPPGGPGMYNRLMAACPSAQRIGYSATPYRLGDGPVYGDLASHWFSTLAVDVKITDLLNDPEGPYLSPLVPWYPDEGMIDTSGVQIQKGEFVTGALSSAATDSGVVEAACDEIALKASGRDSLLVFCIDVNHTMRVAERLNHIGIESQVVVGHTENREDVFDAFKAKQFRALVGCDVFTTGFDAPNVDAIAILRPTMSMGLFVQMIGRGTRLCTGKQDCLVLDFGGNIERHAPIDGVPEPIESERRRAKRKKKEAEDKAQELAREAKEKVKHAARSSDLDLFGNSIRGDWLTVQSIKYVIRRSSSKPVDQMMVFYNCQDSKGMSRRVLIWVCPEHPRRTLAYKKAKEWYARRGLEPPEALRQSDLYSKAMVKPKRILVSKDRDWDRVDAEEF